jgi:hypothetical protein
MDLYFVLENPGLLLLSWAIPYRKNFHFQKCLILENKLYGYPSATLKQLQKLLGNEELFILAFKENRCF